ncbi:hypothetical protein HDU97_000010 [Phlyctochytrium planicorne]|nr:hypothetical protein HDU97_000010 [Phlyctochytrium planicorne]
MQSSRGLINGSRVLRTAICRLQRNAAVATAVRCQMPLFVSPVRGFSASPVSSSLFTDYVKSVKESVKEVNVAYLDKILQEDPTGLRDNFHLFDVREPYEWNEEHIPYAIYTGRGCLERDIEKLVSDTSDEIVLYCAGGNRSILAADTLKRMGYTNVSFLSGGMGAWKRAQKRIIQNFKTYSERAEY